MELLFTHRPYNGTLISVVNSITRGKTKCPFDHVALHHDGWVYESVVGPGVHRIPFDEWVVGREGSWIFIIELGENEIDFAEFKRHKGKKYDARANWLYLTGQTHKLSRKSEKKIYCSELIALMLHKENSYEWTPADLAKHYQTRPFRLLLL